MLSTSCMFDRHTMTKVEPSNGHPTTCDLGMDQRRILTEAWHTCTRQDSEIRTVPRRQLRCSLGVSR